MDAQTWLNQTIPENQKENVRKLLISIPSEQDAFIHQNFYTDYTNKYYLADTLTGNLNLFVLPNLTHLIIEYQRITSLNLNSNQCLEEIDVSDNLLETIEFPWMANHLTRILVSNNNIQPQDLSDFTNYPRLKNLILGTSDIDRIQQGIYNRWTGSLRPLNNLTSLEELDINATNISHGLQFLPLNKLDIFTCGNQGRHDALVNNIKRMLGFNETVASEEIEPIILTEKTQQLIYWQQTFNFVCQQQIAQILQTYPPRNHQ